MLSILFSHIFLLNFFFSEPLITKKRYRRNANFSIVSNDFIDTESSCRRNELVVNFTDMGWSSWVVAPSDFNAYYCSGTCGYPMHSQVNPTNHALVISVIKAVKNLHHLPQSCCVPQTYEPLSLLYFDENKNVVLKNFPQMIVTSCGCS